MADPATENAAANRSEHGTRNSGASNGFGRGDPWRLANGDSAIDDLRMPPTRGWIPLRMRRIPNCHLEPNLVQSRSCVSMHDVMVFLQELNSRLEIPTVPFSAPASKVGPASGLVNSPGPYVRPPDGTARPGTRASELNLDNMMPAGAEQSPNFQPRWKVIDANRFKAPTELPVRSATLVGTVGNSAYDRTGGTKGFILTIS